MTAAPRPQPPLRVLPRTVPAGNPIDLAAEYIDHPLGEEWRRSVRLLLYPPTFQDWLQKRHNAYKATLAAMAADPWCRSPVKLRRHSGGPPAPKRR